MSKLIQSESGEVTRVCTRSFETLEDLKQMLEALEGPVLLHADTEDLNTVLPWLGEHQEVCLNNSPATLIRFLESRLRDRYLDA